MHVFMLHSIIFIPEINDYILSPVKVKQRSDWIEHDYSHEKSFTVKQFVSQNI